VFASHGWKMRGKNSKSREISFFRLAQMEEKSYHVRLI